MSSTDVKLNKSHIHAHFNTRFVISIYTTSL